MLTHGNRWYFQTGPNPPFGKKLKVSARDAKSSNLSIAKHYLKSEGEGDRYGAKPGKYRDTELGITFLERCYDLLVAGGRLGIVLPETYLFSPSKLWLQQWVQDRFIVRGAFNIPMEAFQGFCRAKTNFYVLEKRGEQQEVF